MKFIVASSNPVKINAVKMAVAEHFPEAHVEGLEAPSGVSPQPLSDEETRTGAINRAKAVRQLALGHQRITPTEPSLCIGLEGGVFHPDFAVDPQGLWSTVWGVALDEKGRLFQSNGARFPLPAHIAALIHQGQEMGPALGELLGDADARKKYGMIGYLTGHFTNRTQEYVSIASLAIGLWYGSKD